MHKTSSVVGIFFSCVKVLSKALLILFRFSFLKQDTQKLSFLQALSLLSGRGDDISLKELNPFFLFTLAAS